TTTNCEGTNATNEGTLGYISTTSRTRTTALNRLYQRTSGDHFYTVRRAERDAAIQDGSTSEGITGFVWLPPFYVTPIYEGRDQAVLEDMQHALAPKGSGPNVVLGWSTSTWYMSFEARDASQDYQYDNSRIAQATGLAASLGLPLVVNLNGGRWAESGPLT